MSDGSSFVFVTNFGGGYTHPTAGIDRPEHDTNEELTVSNAERDESDDIHAVDYGRTTHPGLAAAIGWEPPLPGTEADADPTGTPAVEYRDPAASAPAGTTYNRIVVGNCGGEAVEEGLSIDYDSLAVFKR